MDKMEYEIKNLKETNEERSTISKRKKIGCNKNIEEIKSKSAYEWIRQIIVPEQRRQCIEQKRQFTILMKYFDEVNFLM